MRGKPSRGERVMIGGYTVRKLTPAELEEFVTHVQAAIEGRAPRPIPLYEPQELRSGADPMSDIAPTPIAAENAFYTGWLP